MKPPRPLWSVRANGVTWSAELHDHGKVGVEARILRQGELAISRQFDAEALAVQWADTERAMLEDDDGADTSSR